MNSNLYCSKQQHGMKIGLMNSKPSDFQAMGEVTEKDGKKTQRLKKEMLSVGHYIHPLWGWHLDITEDRLHRFAATFKQMKTNGVAVEVPVDHSLSAKDNYGYVVDMFVEKNKKGVPSLYGIHEMIGDEGISLAARNRGVSVLIEKDFKDGKGNAYGEAITHSSIVQQPVVPGQEDFEAIAASMCNKADFQLLLLDVDDTDDESSIALFRGAGLQQSNQQEIQDGVAYRLFKGAGISDEQSRKLQMGPNP